MEVERSAEEIGIDLFLEAIHLRYGYDLREYARDSMRRRVRSALAKSGLAHLGELQHRVVHDSSFFAVVLDDLTVHVSELFRDPAFYCAFREHVVPLLRTYPHLKIWHSGCAAGEEVYATAILLMEEGLYDRSQIYATDLSLGALAQAKQGVYSAESLLAFTRNYREAGGKAELSRYYTEAYGHIAMHESLRRNVSFFHHNLVSDHVFGEMNVIFCRNVVIYFGAGLKRRVFEKFVQSLCPGGFMCLGSSERIAREVSGFSEAVGGQRIYRYEA